MIFFENSELVSLVCSLIKLFKYLDANVPEFGHFPLMKSKLGSSLSKRDNSLSIKEFKEKPKYTNKIVKKWNKK